MKTFLLAGLILAAAATASLPPHASAQEAADLTEQEKDDEESARLQYVILGEGVPEAVRRKAYSELVIVAGRLAGKGNFRGSIRNGHVDLGELSGQMNRIIGYEAAVETLKTSTDGRERMNAQKTIAGYKPNYLVGSAKADIINDAVVEAHRLVAALLTPDLPSIASPGLDLSPATDNTGASRNPQPADDAELKRTLTQVDQYVERHPEDANGLAARSRILQLSGDPAGAEADAKKALILDPANKLARTVYRSVEAQAQAAAKARGVMTGGFEERGDAGNGADAGDPGFTEKGREAAVAAGGGSFKPRSPAERKAALAAMAVAAAGIGPGVTPASQAQALIKSSVEKLALGDFNGALFELSRALLLEPTNVRARVLRAHISNLPKNKNYEAAIRDADEALKLEPGSAAAMFEKGYALLQLGRVDDALRVIEDGLRLDPRNAMGRFYHGMALEKAGLIAKAIEEYRQAAALDPALRPLVEDALNKLALPNGVKKEGGRVPRSVPVKRLLFVLLALTAAALLLEGGKRVFYQDMKTSADAIAAKSPAAPAPSISTLTPGDVLAGNFRIEQELARGGLGIVYRATDVKLKRFVAIKRLNREAYASGEMRERFLKEAQLAARLRHPNLAEIFSIVGEDELCLVFELVEGETVHDRLVRQGKLSVRETADIIRDTAAAIDYAHSQKVIHRDLKPANLMIGRDGRTKVLDFGIAHETRSMTGATQTQAWGTPPYMAPEQETGSVCRESDVYALGVVAYELIAGARPYAGNYLLTMKIEKKYRPIHELVPGAPGELKAFFDKALEPDPEKRFRTAGELARALGAIEPTPVRA